MFRSIALAAAVIVSVAAFGQGSTDFGHSHLGSAFDSGLRTKPWKFQGLGKAPFPITSKIPEVQPWYDQGNELLHSFWFEEAERTFRWCLKLDKENPMIYFGLARCGLNWFTIGAGDQPELVRFREFLKEAVKRKNSAPLRERLYIEAWDAIWSKTGDDARKEGIERLQKICGLFPDDIEAKCQLAFFNIGQGSALANDFLIKQILSVNPMHPGAHHARIHNWDDVDGAQAIASCELYGKAAPGVGHALHMPGHIYSGIGMWHEAAIAMDSATRVELRHMNERMAFPFENWNYPHNRDYLCYIQEQLGHAAASIRGSMDILNSPKDPAFPNSEYPAIVPLSRAYLKFEMWEQILDDQALPTPASPELAGIKEAARIIALAELGRKEKAREALTAFKIQLNKMIEETPGKTPEEIEKARKDAEEFMPLTFKTAEAKVLLAEGKRSEGLEILLEVAEKERLAREAHRYSNDPPSEPWPTMRVIGDVYFAGGEYAKAVKSYEKSLSYVVNDAWSLAGLAKTHLARGDKETATRYAERFMAVWSGADPNLKVMKEVLALNLKVTPRAETLKPERKYVPAALDKIGPSNWRPFAAPKLDCVDSNGRRVQLSDFKGKNVLLVFYLSDQCVHCMEQLGKINTRMEEFSSLNTVVLAVSAATPEANKESTKLAPFKVSLLSDVNHSNARRFASYDDFEDMELHSTTLIDSDGLVRWKRSGGDPFSDVDFLVKEIKRWGLNH